VDSPSRERVLPLLRGRFGRDYRFEPECASTQRLLSDSPEGAVVATDFQSEGRGRLGRRWEAPAGTSLLFSIALAPRVPAERLSELSLVAGRAVAAAVAELAGVEAEVKFPNDVLVHGRKVAGILAEAAEGRVVLGVGVNVHQREADLPADTQHPASSLLLESGRAVDRAALLAAILVRLETAYDDWTTRLRLPAGS
jgi:BirA family transcriptional regulator, biotin operon repressor / biotin---[acetyl-CoA-carboxylase] ligase